MGDRQRIGPSAQGRWLMILAIVIACMASPALIAWLVVRANDRDAAAETAERSSVMRDASPSLWRAA